MMSRVLRTLVKAGVLLGSKARAEHVWGAKFYLQNQKKNDAEEEEAGKEKGEKKRANPPL